MALAAVALVLSTAAASPRPARIAVVGGGLAGLGCTYHLLAQSAEPLDCVHVWDPCGPGEGGASAVAAGLLHPYSPKGTHLWRGREGLVAALDLVRAVEAHSGGRVCQQDGMIRVALDEAQALAYRSLAPTTCQEGSGQQWVSQAELAAIAGSEVGGRGALHVPGAFTVDTRAYLRGLWSLCASLGGTATDVSWVNHTVGSLEGLQPPAGRGAGYDAIIVAAGARTTSISDMGWIPLRPCRGQNLLLRNTRGLRTPLISGKYIVPAAADGGLTLIAGATFEYGTVEACFQPADQAVAQVCSLRNGARG
jgi:glycine/D-amino acid oxidase-like deaminating enzyme